MGATYMRVRPICEDIRYMLQLCSSNVECQLYEPNSILPITGDVMFILNREMETDRASYGPGHFSFGPRDYVHCSLCPHLDDKITLYFVLGWEDGLLVKQVFTNCLVNAKNADYA